MKLTFESNLQFQQGGIKSITGLFEGQAMEESILGNNVNVKCPLTLVELGY